MDVRVLSLDKTEMEVEVLGENETLLNPIKQALLKDKDVDFAEYIIEHPVLGRPRIFLRTTGADPQTVLKRTMKTLTDDLDAFEKELVKSLKKQ